jgi:hypothetical protein
MFDLTALHEFSRCHCVAICAALIPANLLISTAAIGLAVFDRSAAVGQRWLSRAGVICGLLLIAHVASWWLVGVVAPATFILPTLGLVCMGVNWTCRHHPAILQRLWQAFAPTSWKSSSI